MLNIVIQDLAREILDVLELAEPRTFKRIITALDDLERTGMQSPSIKKLSNSDSIFRKRVGRYRILFTLTQSRVDIWIIEIEKDTKKDYTRWMKYIRRKV